MTHRDCTAFETLEDFIFFDRKPFVALVSRKRGSHHETKCLSGERLPI